jgi:hypothetical protein
MAEGSEGSTVVVNATPVWGWIGDAPATVFGY